ncbi:MAG TPA: hypothetical protein VMM18_03625 [Gemmatimonadaceae bacterium]|nr:hypothetical protein [Gemmatimonadaceae bacterium]
MARLPHRIGTTLLLALISPVLLAAILVALPAIGVMEARRWLRTRAVRRAFEERWGRHGMRIVLAYSDDTRWRERIEREWLPRIGRQVVVLDWNTRQTFRDGAPIEAQVFERWAGRRDFDPMAIVIPPRGRVRTLRFRDAFIAYFGGAESALAAAEDVLFSLAERMREQGGVAAPEGALPAGMVTRRNA